MENKYLLIGGRSHDFCNKSKIYDFFTSDTEKILYVSLANDDYHLALNNFRQQISKNISIDIVDIYNICQFKDYFNKNTHIFFAGGNSNILIKRIKDYHLEDTIKSSKNKFIAAISAGAIMLCAYGLGDRDVFFDLNSYYNFKMVKGLGILPYVICPHYQKNGIEVFNEMVKKHPYDGLCLEDDTAILISKNGFDIIKDTKSNSIYKLNKDKGYLLEPLYERM